MIERFSTEDSSIPQDKKGQVRSFSEMRGYLPEGLSERELKLLQGYFRAQRLVANGNPEKARRVFRGLDNQADFREFEDRNRDLLSRIQTAVLGETRQYDGGASIPRSVKIKRK